MPSAGADPGSVYKTNSTTTVPKVTYVPLKPPSDELSLKLIATTGGAIRKFSWVRSLRLQTGEVEAALSSGTFPATTTPNPLSALLKPFEGSPVPSTLPDPSAFSSVIDDDLAQFGRALVTHRNQAVAAMQQPSTPVGSTVAIAPAPAQLAAAVDLANSAAGALKSLNSTTNTATSPIGMLNLERIEMTPAGIQQGGLIATIPLAPKERTVVVQQEWSVISQDFQSIVTDSLENYSETGVTDSTQLSQSTTSQVSHANQFNVNASVMGSYGFVTASANSSFAAQDQHSDSATASRQHSVQTTKKASSRSIQSHKTTISTSTTTGSSTSNTRMLENPSATDPMRIDYFSLMRKWYCALYRYGLRLTYDITVPEPAAAMREIYAQIDQYQQIANKQFTFNVKHSDITTDIRPGDTEPYYLVLADQYLVDVPPPPSPATLVYQVGPVYFSLTNDVRAVPFSVDSNFWIESIIFTSWLSHDSSVPFSVVGSNAGELTQKNSVGVDLCANQSYLWHQSGSLSITTIFTSNSSTDGECWFNVNCVPSDTAMETWRGTVWTALYNAAQTQYYAQIQAANAQITALQDKINNVDTLTLRREENDEIMKCALRWLLGDNFEFMPQNVVNLFQQTTGSNVNYGINFTGNDSQISGTKDWSIVKQNLDRINFINQAIDWDNVIYFAYSYFWDVPQSWDFIRQLQHADATRQAFLRAGSARVVLTVRKGWELAWTYFVEFHSTTMPNPLPPHPYLTIAQQIQDYDSINYPGIPPANPDGGGPVDDGTPQVGTTSTATLTPSSSPVSITVADSTGFLPGATAIIDTWDSQVQESPTIVSVPNGTTIVVASISKAHQPSSAAANYPIVQAGEEGLLIAEWFEYTPTSGVDIAVSSNLATIT